MTGENDVDAKPLHAGRGDGPAGPGMGGGDRPDDGHAHGAGGAGSALKREADAARMLLDAMSLRDEDDDVIETAIEGETSFMEAVDAALLRLVEIDAMAKGIDQAIERLQTRSSRLEAQAARIRSSMLLAIDTVGLKKLERPTATLSLAKSPDKVVVTNEESLPARYLVEKTTIAPDKKALLADLKAGIAILGAELSNGGVQLRINKG